MHQVVNMAKFAQAVCK